MQERSQFPSGLVASDIPQQKKETIFYETNHFWRMPEEVIPITNTNKACVYGDIPFKQLRSYLYLFIYIYICNIYRRKNKYIYIHIYLLLH